MANVVIVIGGQPFALDDGAAGRDRALLVLRRKGDRAHFTLELGQDLGWLLCGVKELALLPLIPYTWLKVRGWQPPQEWASYATQALSLQGGFTFGGALFGLLGGLAWFTSQGGFRTEGPLGRLLLRFLVGIIGVLIIRYGLKFIFPDGDTVLAYILRYVRYSLIGFWITAAAPWAFVRLKLAERAK